MLLDWRVHGKGVLLGTRTLSFAGAPEMDMNCSDCAFWIVTCPPLAGVINHWTVIRDDFNRLSAKDAQLGLKLHCRQVPGYSLLRNDSLRVPEYTHRLTYQTDSQESVASASFQCDRFRERSGHWSERRTEPRVRMRAWRTCEPGRDSDAASLERISVPDAGAGWCFVPIPAHLKRALSRSPLSFPHLILMRTRWNGRQRSSGGALLRVTVIQSLAPVRQPISGMIVSGSSDCRHTRGSSTYLDC